MQCTSMLIFFCEENALYDVKASLKRVDFTLFHCHLQFQHCSKHAYHDSGPRLYIH